MEELIVYQTELKEANSGDCDTNMIWDEKCPAPRWFVFFSPSSVEGMLLRVPSSSDMWQNVRIGSIGKTTAAALANTGFKVHAIASNPTPEDLMAAICDYENKNAPP